MKYVSPHTRFTRLSFTLQLPSVALLIASTYSGEAFPFDLFELRVVDEAICDDMLLCVDALRWGQTDLHKPGPRRRPEGVGGDRPMVPQAARGPLTTGRIGD